MKTLNIIVLVLSGLALFYACSMRLFIPEKAVFLQTYFENPDNSLGIHVDLVNEVRGEGAVMFLGGMVAILGALRSNFRQSAFVTVTVIFAGVILGRSLSFFIDGMPSTNLIRVAVVESVLAALNIYCLVNSLLQAKGSIIE